MDTPTGGDDRPVFHLLRNAEEHGLRRRELMIDFAGIRPAILIAGERAFVLREPTAGIRGEELILIGVFDGAEKVGLVLDDRAAECAAVLPSAEVRALALE